MRQTMKIRSLGAVSLAMLLSTPLTAQVTPVAPPTIVPIVDEKTNLTSTVIPLIQEQANQC
jgi:hypothetical protein